MSDSSFRGGPAPAERCFLCEETGVRQGSGRTGFGTVRRDGDDQGSGTRHDSAQRKNEPGRVLSQILHAGLQKPMGQSRAGDPGQQKGAGRTGTGNRVGPDHQFARFRHGRIPGQETGADPGRHSGSAPRQILGGALPARIHPADRVLDHRFGGPAAGQRQSRFQYRAAGAEFPAGGRRSAAGRQTDRKDSAQRTGRRRQTLGRDPEIRLRDGRPDGPDQEPGDPNRSRGQAEIQTGLHPDQFEAGRRPHHGQQYSLRRHSVQIVRSPARQLRDPGRKGRLRSG